MEAHFRHANLLARILFNVFHVRPRILGRENLSGVEPPYIVVSNHASNIDPPLLWGYFPDPVFFLAKAELASVPIIGWISRKVGNVHVHRDGRDIGPLRQALRMLKEEKKSLAIFVEGTRRPDEGLADELKPGAAMLAARTGVPVVPVHLEGTGKVAPPGTLVPIFAPVTMRIGKPVALGLPAGEKPGPEALREANERIRAAILGLAPGGVVT